MNKEEILETPVGHELNILVTEKVMGYKLMPFNPKDWFYPSYTKDNTVVLLWENPFVEGKRFSPSTDIAAAWEVVEKMIAKMDDYPEDNFSWRGPLYKPTSQYLTNEGYPLGTTCWYVLVESYNLGRICICGNTAEEAICKAALMTID